jgi:hypothetical protein
MMPNSERHTSPRTLATSGHVIASSTYHFDCAAPDRRAERRANP